MPTILSLLSEDAILNGAAIETVIIFHTERGIVRQLYFVRNPDKLARIRQ
ncbi:hypothetical protein [Paenibacillus apiarius]|uniref:Uncharacterized protein n=1 Tax=Paenibacillus apiarius TaxID=46240 RepID=A0ABT4DW90_9BACL|nr:hypothetical protein [Paenibacillus apiarius]MBN3526598.1 hypothetical protein [Paenibacillus apiarius]MCY9513024.1 hypothetical protein [Paenibacillus apiarius]MCY9521620.1 hypothetical protein [Paenibacillus apiarius]MCY9551772.1 hypothetical protein [Paenibacillus apiarius]MCY9560439.1 hypothetical protein [Paenibacillus apiarius]